MSKTIRLIYPQWQGGVISQWVTELSAEDSSRGYYLGVQLLNTLAPKNDLQETFEVPIWFTMFMPKSILRQSKTSDGILKLNWVI